MYAFALPPVTDWVIPVPTTGVPVNVEVSLIAPRDEYWFSVKTTVSEEYMVGFFIIPTCENLVSIGKSFVESSNLAYINILSVPNSV